MNLQMKLHQKRLVREEGVAQGRATCGPKRKRVFTSRMADTWFCKDHPRTDTVGTCPLDMAHARSQDGNSRRTHWPGLLIPRDISSLGLRGRQQTPVWQGCGGRAQGAHMVPLGPPPAQNLGCKWPCRPPFACPGHSGFPPALQSDQRGTEHGSGAFRQPRTCPSEPRPAHLPEGQRHPVSMSRAAAWGSGRVSKGGARSPAFCPHLTATSDHTPSGPSALLTSQKATTWCWTVSRWAWPSPSRRG